MKSAGRDKKTFTDTIAGHYENCISVTDAAKLETDFEQASFEVGGGGGDGVWRGRVGLGRSGRGQVGASQGLARGVRRDDERPSPLEASLG